MSDYRLNKLVSAVQFAMGKGFRVTVVDAAGTPDSSSFQLEAVAIRAVGRRARSEAYPRDSAKPLSELIGLCANTLKTKLQTRYPGDERESRAIW